MDSVDSMRGGEALVLPRPYFFSNLKPVFMPE